MDLGARLANEHISLRVTMMQGTSELSEREALASMAVRLDQMHALSLAEIGKLKREVEMEREAKNMLVKQAVLQKREIQRLQVWGPHAPIPRNREGLACHIPYAELFISYRSDLERTQDDLADSEHKLESWKIVMLARQRRGQMKPTPPTTARLQSNPEGSSESGSKPASTLVHRCGDEVESIFS